MITTIPQYEKTVDLFKTINTRISRLGKTSDEKRNEIKEHLRKKFENH